MGKFGTDTKLWIDDPSSIPGSGKHFSLTTRVQTCSMAHPASYPIMCQGSFTGEKRQESEAYR